jgi:site-specific DNA-methyltransferase (adenine-specific)
MIDLRLGDCIEILKTLPDNSVDSIVTDPPYGLSFMGKKWDYDVPSVDIWKECLRVLKPGGHLLSFGGSRTYHRMAVAIEDAGFEIRDQIMWIYGSGFPKSHNIGKAIDKIEGNEREVIGYVLQFPDGTRGATYRGQANNSNDVNFFVSKDTSTNGLKPVYAKNNEWEGWGTALKPAHEPICMARKPLSEKTIAENVLKHGTGGINIDASRIPFDMTDTNPATNPLYRQENEYKMPEKGQESNGSVSFTSSKNEISQEGRFPANIMFDEEAGKILDEQSGISKSTGSVRKKDTDTDPSSMDFKHKEGENSNPYAGQTGGASRFFYCPKVSKKERGDGNIHPTVKPIVVMEYLIRLVTPKGGIVLEPFMGSGSTGIAAKNLGMSFIGVEKEEEYFEIAKQRINGN